MRALSAGTVLALSLAALPALTARPARADERQAAHALLRERYPDYRAAVAAFEAGAANAADFERIAATGDLALKAHATFFLGRAALEVDDFDRACAAFERVGSPGTELEFAL